MANEPVLYPLQLCHHCIFPSRARPGISMHSAAILKSSQSMSTRFPTSSIPKSPAIYTCDDYDMMLCQLGLISRQVVWSHKVCSAHLVSRTKSREYDARRGRSRAGQRGGELPAFLWPPCIPVLGDLPTAEIAPSDAAAMHLSNMSSLWEGQWMLKIRAGAT